MIWSNPNFTARIQWYETGPYPFAWGVNNCGSKLGVIQLANNKAHTRIFHGHVCFLRKVKIFHTEKADEEASLKNRIVIILVFWAGELNWAESPLSPQETPTPISNIYIHTKPHANQTTARGNMQEKVDFFPESLFWYRITKPYIFRNKISNLFNTSGQ